MQHDEDEDYLDGPEMQKVLALIDQAWVITPEEQRRCRALFFQKLRAKEPNHPWLNKAAEEGLL